MYCPNCGKKISVHTKFCPYCGAKQKLNKSQVDLLGASNNQTNSSSINKNKKHHFGKFIAILCIIVLIICGGYGLHRHNQESHVRSIIGNQTYMALKGNIKTLMSNKDSDNLTFISFNHGNYKYVNSNMSDNSISKIHYRSLKLSGNTFNYKGSYYHPVTDNHCENILVHHLKGKDKRIYQRNPRKYEKPDFKFMHKYHVKIFMKGQTILILSPTKYSHDKVAKRGINDILNSKKHNEIVNKIKND